MSVKRVLIEYLWVRERGGEKGCASWWKAEREVPCRIPEVGVDLRVVAAGFVVECVES